jgi:CheY-like chemotaxis protein
MLILKKCPFYRDFKNLSWGKGLGDCDLGGLAICEGDIQLCDKSADLNKQMSEEKKKEDDIRAGEPKEKQLCYRVLVVDDQKSIRELVMALLSREGHQCINAGNGVEALNEVIRHKCDVVITDIVMPKKDGITLTKELLTLYPKLPILVMTGYTKEYPTGLAIAAGARDFVGKPFGNDEFILRFNKMMRDQEVSLEIEAKQREILFQNQRKSSERINELKKEIENLTSRLSNGYRGVRL